MSRIGLSPGWFARRLARTICHGTCRHCFSRARTAERHSARSVQRETRRTLGGAAIGCGVSAAVFRVGAHRGTALRPIRSTSDSWDPWGSGDPHQAAGAHRERTLDSGPWNAILLAWGPWGETWAQVVRILAHRERESVTLLISEKLYEMARRAPAAANHSANGSVPCHASLRRQKHKTAAVALEILYKIMYICQGPF